jgi:hypothetical protein
MQNINPEKNISQTILTTHCLCFDLLMHIVKQLGISNCTLVSLNTALQSCRIAELVNVLEDIIQRILLHEAKRK